MGLHAAFGERAVVITGSYRLTTFDRANPYLDATLIMEPEKIDPIAQDFLYVWWSSDPHNSLGVKHFTEDRVERLRKRLEAAVRRRKG